MITPFDLFVGAHDLFAEDGTLYHLRTTEGEDGTAAGADLVGILGTLTSHQSTTEY